jgi:hypothetical protein
MGLQQLSAIPEEAGKGDVEMEVKELWTMFKMLQTQLETMSFSFHKNLEQRCGTLEADVVELRQKVSSVQDLRVTDALDYAEAEVQDLRATLEKMQEQQEGEASRAQRNQTLLMEQIRLMQTLQASHEKHCTDVLDLQEQLLRDSQMRPDAEVLAGLAALRGHVEVLESKLVTDLETQLVAGRARMARQECEHERAVQTLQARIDAFEIRHKNTNTSNPWEDLQAVVNRQLLEEDAVMAAADAHKAHSMQVHQITSADR